ncbi:MAG: EAL domain-containing protein [Campylobacterota bacterium]|nr:EAL domain-containing protein [Campylobacterota bacterium]
MKNQQLYNFLHRQILPMISLSLGPGIVYIILGWMYGIAIPAILWYLLMLLLSIWGYHLYKKFLSYRFREEGEERWYREVSYFFYLIFGLWTFIFYLYVKEDAYNLHYIAIFTQIGASAVASTLLASDKRLYTPVLLILMVPLITYFSMIGEWYGYILMIFSMILAGVFFYSSTNTYNLLQKSIYQASHDQLTGLYSRHFFNEYLQTRIKRLRHPKMYAYLLLIDLDHFKTINDSLGHDIGDKLLINVTERMYRHGRKDHMFARLGGDEFLVIGGSYRDKDKCIEKALSFSDELLELLKRHYVIERHHLYISASIGVSLLDSRSSNINRFIKEADIAMYEVKEQGRDGVFLFDEEMAKRVERNLKIEQLLYSALPNHEMSLMYQPQFDREKNIIGCEVLVRWESKELGLILPTEFIPIAEHTGLIIELGHSIIEESFKALRDWNEKGISLKQFSVNISMRQFFHHSFISEIELLCKKYLSKSLRSKLIFEMTETVVAEDVKKVVKVMNLLKQMGIRFSMDDFGTGYSSLSYIKQMPIEEIKIDRSFVNGLNESESAQAMIKTILNIADIFKLKVVAEGIESEEQEAFLIENSCDILQGYFLSSPLTKETFEELYFRS